MSWPESAPDACLELRQCSEEASSILYNRACIRLLCFRSKLGTTTHHYSGEELLLSNLREDTRALIKYSYGRNLTIMSKIGHFQAMSRVTRDKRANKDALKYITSPHLLAIENSFAPPTKKSHTLSSKPVVQNFLFTFVLEPGTRAAD